MSMTMKLESGSVVSMKLGKRKHHGREIDLDELVEDSKSPLSSWKREAIQRRRQKMPKRKKCVDWFQYTDIWIYILQFAGKSTQFFMTIRHVSKLWNKNSYLMIPIIDVILNSANGSLWIPFASKVKSCEYHGQCQGIDQNDKIIAFEDFPFRTDASDPFPNMTNLKKLTIVEQSMEQSTEMFYLKKLTELTFRHCWIESLDLSSFPNLKTLRLINCWSYSRKFINRFHCSAIGSVEFLEILYDLSGDYHKWTLHSIMILIQGMLDKPVDDPCVILTTTKLSRLSIVSPDCHISIDGIDSIRKTIKELFPSSF
jgi:hypothetical protein